MHSAEEQSPGSGDKEDLPLKTKPFDFQECKLMHVRRKYMVPCPASNRDCDGIILVRGSAVYHPYHRMRGSLKGPFSKKIFKDRAQPVVPHSETIRPLLRKTGCRIGVLARACTVQNGRPLLVTVFVRHMLSKMRFYPPLGYGMLFYMQERCELIVAR